MSEEQDPKTTPRSRDWVSLKTASRACVLHLVSCFMYRDHPRRDESPGPWSGPMDSIQARELMDSTIAVRGCRRCGALRHLIATEQGLYY